MDTENPQKTITGSLVQRPSTKPSEPTRDQIKLGVLLRLGSHYWPKDFTPAQANAFLDDFISDLIFTSPEHLEIVCGEWRRNADNTRFPRSGELLRMVAQLSSPMGRSRLATFKGYPEIEGPRATKSAAQILKEHGFS